MKNKIIVALLVSISALALLSFTKSTKKEQAVAATSQSTNEPMGGFASESKF